LTGTIFDQADLSGARASECDLTDSKLTGAVLKSVDLKGATLTGAIFDEADLSGALMINAIFNVYAAPAKKAAAGQGAQLGRAVAKAVGKGLWAEFRGGDSESSEDEGGGSQEEDIVEEGQNMIDGDDLAYALDQVKKLMGTSSYMRFKRFAKFSGSLQLYQLCQLRRTPRKLSVPGRGDGGRRARAVGASSGGALTRVRQGHRTSRCDRHRFELGLIQLV
jgi:uncharacterized protein YjbI with pentapeptide repeats